MIVILILIYLIFGRVLPWSLAVTLSLIVGRRLHVGWLFGLIGLIGLFEDVVAVRPFGFGAAVLVTITFVTWLIGSQYSRKTTWWWIGVGVCGEILMRLVEGKTISVGVLLGQIGCLLVVEWLGRRWHRQEGIYVGR